VQLECVIVAAGASNRFGGVDKLSADLCGRPALAWSLAVMADAPSISGITVVTAAGRIDEVRALGRQWAPRKFRGALSGGARRRDSVEAGMRACQSQYVAVHDGARPLVTAAQVEAVVAAAEGRPGAIAAVPVTDTIKEAGDDRIIAGHPARRRLWAAQTPQVVLRQAWLDAAATSDNDETDDAAMLSRLGLECVVVECSTENLKVTRPLDLEIARLVLQRRAAGGAP